MIRLQATCNVCNIFLIDELFDTINGLKIDTIVEHKHD